MARKKRYQFNEQTLAYEVHNMSMRKRFSRGFVLFVLSILAFCGYFFIYTQHLGLEPPKTTLLKQKYAELDSKYELLQRKFEQSSQVLDELQMRDNNIYRPIFGMEELSKDVRDAGFGGVNRYAHLETASSSDALLKAVKRMDVIYKKAYVQSKSYDEVALLAKRAGDMASCVPAIPPVALDNVRLSSLFGYRSDPFSGAKRMHQGIDLSGNKGEPIYAAGSGKIVEVRTSFFGYGREIVIDHGFGYQTRYAHLQKMFVNVGDEVQRGEQIATMGNTGKSKGVHLHYEVIYRNRRVNPLNYYSQDVIGEEYMAMVTPYVERSVSSID